MSTVVKFPGVTSKGAHAGLEREEKIVNDKRCMEFQVVLVRQRTAELFVLNLLLLVVLVAIAVLIYYISLSKYVFLQGRSNRA